MKKWRKSQWHSFRCAFKGLEYLFRTQTNAQIHLVITTAVLLSGWFFQLSTMEWCSLVIAITLVLGAEAFNTALETLTDLVSPDYHPLAGRAKDVAAGGVMICSIGAVIIGLMVFVPHLWALWGE
jgi:diacylglycerol kinase